MEKRRNVTKQCVQWITRNNRRQRKMLESVTAEYSISRRRNRVEISSERHAARQVVPWMRNFRKVVGKSSRPSRISRLFLGVCARELWSRSCARNGSASRRKPMNANAAGNARSFMRPASCLIAEQRNITCTCALAACLLRSGR